MDAETIFGASALARTRYRIPKRPTGSPVIQAQVAERSALGVPPPDRRIGPASRGVRLVSGTVPTSRLLPGRGVRRA
jgi:hypothetical protein